MFESDWDLEFKSGCKGVQGLKEALKRRVVFHKTKKKTAERAFESTGVSCNIGKGWTGAGLG
jgi:hypothetical protein